MLTTDEQKGFVRHVTVKVMERLLRAAESCGLDDGFYERMSGGATVKRPDADLYPRRAIWACWGLFGSLFATLQSSRPGERSVSSYCAIHTLPKCLNSTMHGYAPYTPPRL